MIIKVPELDILTVEEAIKILDDASVYGFQIFIKDHAVYYEE